jgi:eukaryotic-like serine/threonine-protein kinase
MSGFKFESWRAVSPYLDQALTMTDEELSAWLASLREQDPQLAGAVQTLLDEHDMAARERFLEGHARVPAREALSGQSVGAYRLVSRIGQGGMGTVWLAERSDGRFERRVAIKLMNVALLNRAGEERFEREGKILGRLLHPNIAELIDAGVFSIGQPYLVLEHVDGHHIDQYCDSHKLDVESRIRLFLDLLAAV